MDALEALLELRHPAGVLQGLVQLLAVARDADVLPERRPQGAHLLDRLAQAAGVDVEQNA